MPTIRLLKAVKKPRTGSAGSSATEQGFDVDVEITPNLEVYRVAVVWTENRWQTVNYSDCRCTGGRNGAEAWTASINYSTTPQITFLFALAAAAPSGVVWDNNQGWNYLI